MRIAKIIKLLCLSCLLLFALSIYADRSPLDDDIVDAIQSEITLDEDLYDADIDVTCHNGLVQLEGEVNSIELKNRILDITQSTEGVKKIDDSKLIINPY